MKYPSRHIWKGVKKKSQHLILTKSYYVNGEPVGGQISELLWLQRLQDYYTLERFGGSRSMLETSF